MAKSLILNEVQASRSQFHQPWVDKYTRAYQTVNHS
jgi:hypothetical protein